MKKNEKLVVSMTIEKTKTTNIYKRNNIEKNDFEILTKIDRIDF